jgi:hypothetical protein
VIEADTGNGVTEVRVAVRIAVKVFDKWEVLTFRVMENEGVCPPLIGVDQQAALGIMLNPGSGELLDVRGLAGPQQLEKPSGVWVVDVGADELLENPRELGWGPGHGAPSGPREAVAHSVSSDRSDVAMAAGADIELDKAHRDIAACGLDLT